MASVAGAAVPAGLAFDGVDLTPALRGEDALPERTLFWAYRNQRAVRRGPWKLLIQGDNVRLYNLKDDLAEQRDLSGSRHDLVAELRRALTAWERDVSGDD
jgi:arylsulfatase A-like enzyme